MDEFWEIIDEYGNPTGEIVSRSNPRAYEDGIYHWAVDLWIINSDNKILIQRRSKEKKFEPNVWAMTGGNVISGESFENALKRELKEELDIDLDLEKVTCFTKVKGKNAIIKQYLIRQDYDISKMKYQTSEVSEVKWASWDEINELDKNKEFITLRWQYVKEYLKKEIEK